MVKSGSPVDGLHRGVAMTTTALEIGTKHTEKNTVEALLGGSKDMFLGMIKLWQQYGIVNLPIFDMTELSNNVIYTNGFGQAFQYMIPGKFSLPITLEDINDSSLDRLGERQEPFYIVLNTNYYTKTDILTPDYFSDIQAFVDPTAEVLPYGDGWLYQMRLTNPLGYIPRKYVRPGQEWVKITNYETEWSTEASTITKSADTLTTFRFETGQTKQSIEHWITGEADQIEYGTNAPLGPMGINKGLIQQNADPHTAALLYFFETLGDPRDPNNPDRVKNAIPNTGFWMPVILKMLMQEQAKMQEMNLMYNRGGIVHDARGTMRRLGMGYYPQIRELGMHRTYSDTRQIGQILKDMVGELFYGRTDLPMHKRRVKFEMGMGALIEAQKYFAEQFKQHMVFPLINHNVVNQVLTGDNMNLQYNGYRFTSFNFPEAGYVEIEHNPALDWEGTKNQQSYKGGRSFRSYSILIKDITDQKVSNALQGTTNDVKDAFNNGPNVVMIKPKGFETTRMWYEVGRYCPDFLRSYVGAGTNAHIASSSFDGFKVGAKWAGEVWVKDPSRTVLIELEDPIRDM